MSIKDWKVLVVEDEHDSMELVQGIFEHYGVDSVGSPTAEDALNTLKDHEPTLIIVDLALPGMDGWRLLNEIKGKPALGQVPCVAITAYHSAETATQAIRHGFDAYFSKPIDATSFMRELEGIVNK